MRTETARAGNSQPGVAAVRPRILVLSTRNPYPPRQGDDVRLVGLLRAAATLGDSTLAVWGQAGERDGAEVPVQVFPLSQWAIVSGVVRHQLSRRPLIVGPYSRSFPMVVGTWDLVVGFQLKTWQWARTVPARIHVLDMVDSLARYASSPQLPRFKKLQLFGVVEEEARALAALDQVWVATEVEREYLSRLRDGKVTVVPNGPLLTKFLPRAEPGKCLLFVGNLMYPPNRQGLRWFLSEVWPQLHPDGFRLEVIGKGSEGMAKLPGIRAHGSVPELEPFYANADLVISPVSWGGGSQVKIWEALGYGRRVLATPVGSAIFGPRSEILTADGAECWAASIREATALGAQPTGDVVSVTENMRRAVSAVLSQETA